MQVQLLQVVLDASTDATVPLLTVQPALLSHQYDFVLALRGFLGCHVLEHVLMQRHQVDYGINRCAGVCIAHYLL